MTTDEARSAVAYGMRTGLIRVRVSKAVDPEFWLRQKHAWEVRMWRDRTKGPPKVSGLEHREMQRLCMARLRAERAGKPWTGIRRMRKVRA